MHNDLISVISYINFRVHELRGHKMPITCLLLLDRNVLVSGSSDRTIRVFIKKYTFLLTCFHKDVGLDEREMQEGAYRA